MNMISTGAFLNEMDASNKQPTLAEQFAAVWEKKNAKAARAGGVSLMALSLAACGSSSSDTSSNSGGTSTVTTTDSLSNESETVSFSGVMSAPMVWSPGGDTRTESLQSDDQVTGSGAADTINVTTDGGNVAPKLIGIETVNYNLAGDTAAVLNMSNSSGYTNVNVTSTDGDVTVTGLGADAVMGANNISDPATNAAFQMTSSAVTGATSATVSVDGFLGTNLNVGASAAAATNGTGVETLTLKASGSTSSIANLGSSGVTTLNVDADAKLTISALSSTSVKTIDLTGSTASTSIDADANANAQEFTYTGGAGDDTIIINTAFAGTDKFTGGDGDDTLSIRILAAGGDTTAVGALNSDDASVVSGFETLDMRSVDDANAGAASANDMTVDMDTVAGVTAVTMRAGDESAKTVFTLNDLTAEQAGNLTVTHTGTDGDTASEVIVDMKSNGTDTVKLSATTTADGQVVELNDSNDNIENAEITLAGAFAANLDVDVSSFLTALTVTGGAADETLTVTRAHTSTTVDMSGVASDITMTAGAGNQTVKTGAGDDTLTNASGNKTIELGAGSDTFVTTVAQITKKDSVDAGDGTDTLKLTSIDTIAATAFASVSGFERLAINQNDLGGDKTIDFDNFVDTLARVSIGATNDKVVTLDDAPTSFDDLRFTKDFADPAVAVTTAEAILNRKSDGTTDALNLNIAGGNTVKTLTLNDEETITFTASGSGTATITTLNVSDATTFNITGGNTLTISTLAGESKLATIDASTATAVVNINASDSMVNMIVSGNAASAGKLTIDTGAGTDTITGSYTGDDFNGGIGNDTISGLGGADTIDGDGGNDTLTGGDGADTFVIGEGSDTITDFSLSAGDKIKLDISGIEALKNDGDAVDLVQIDQSATSVSDTNTLKGKVITGAIDLNTLTGDENMLVLDGTVAQSALTTVLGTGGTFAVTHQTTLADNDAYIVLSTDGTNAYLNAVSNNSGGNITDGNTNAAADMTTSLLATFTGVTDVGDWATTNETTYIA